MNNRRTQSHAIDLEHGGVLVLYTQDTSIVDTVAHQTDSILRWLGTPKGFTVYLWWRDDARTLRADEWPSRKTVNGGWTTSHSREVHIYRSEEWDRVLIHEAIHALGWDWNMSTLPLPCWKFTDRDRISPHLFEAWTELLAEWLWCGWHNVSWQQQMEWQRFQAVQILARRKYMPTWNENTSVFAYYVLKATLAKHIAFLWMAGNGKTLEERERILCEWVQPELATLRNEANNTQPVAISLRMTTEHDVKN